MLNIHFAKICFALWLPAIRVGHPDIAKMTGIEFTTGSKIPCSRKEVIIGRRLKINLDKRGPNRICVLGSIPDANLKADRPIRAVGLREDAMREKIKEFHKKGWTVPSQSH